ncbi:MAG: DegT/DnrJ/EryC1/StrS aminotransferase family protein, partial [Deltaproteobacteria bacterium]|nr:DegT/DnrJ/EryC1/StrS aminotransferase family protein [Deltaproteobacteria bacterium]
MEHPFIPFALPLIEAEEKEAVLKVLDSGWLTTGTQNLQFEKDFAAYVGARHAIAVNSCTAALHLALEAVGLQSGDEVITTPFTFTATAEVVRYFNAKPVFADIDPDTFNIAPQAIAKGRGTAWHPGKAKAIIPVHYGGIACDMDPILALAKENGMKVIEDAAHTLPTWYKGRKVGVLGDITCFSFYVTKTITTGE